MGSSFRTKTHGLLADQIADSMMPPRAFTTGNAGGSMIAVSVQDAIAARTPGVCISVRHQQLETELSHKMHTTGAVGNCCKESPAPNGSWKLPSGTTLSSVITLQTEPPRLDGLAELTDPQVGLRLLRTCGSFSRMVHSMRCNPPHSQSIALDMFDSMTRRCFGGLTGVHSTATQWQQAARGLAHGGLGLRSCEHHASAAFSASVGGSLAACAKLDPAFSANEQKSSPAVAAAWPTSMPTCRHTKL